MPIRILLFDYIEMIFDATAATFYRLTDGKYDTVRMTDQTTSSSIKASQEWCTGGRGI
jgi:hypothetical protein